MKILYEKMFTPVHLESGNIFSFTFTDENGVIYTHKETVTKNTIFNKMVVFQDDTRFGMDNTFGMVVGEACD